MTMYATRSKETADHVLIISGGRLREDVAMDEVRDTLEDFYLGAL